MLYLIDGKLRTSCSIIGPGAGTRLYTIILYFLDATSVYLQHSCILLPSLADLIDNRLFPHICKTSLLAYSPRPSNFTTQHHIPTTSFWKASSISQHIAKQFSHKIIQAIDTSSSCASPPSSRLSTSLSQCRPSISPALSDLNQTVVVQTAVLCQNAV